MGTNGKTFSALQAKVDKIFAEFGEQVVWLVFEGDYGGQIYLTIPWKFVGRRARISTLLGKFDRLAWGCNNGAGRCAYIYWKDAEHMEMERKLGFECGVSAGMGGGALYENLPWMHEEFYGQPVSFVQEVVDEIRGATCEEVAAMGWLTIIYELVDFQLSAYRPA